MTIFRSRASSCLTQKVHVGTVCCSCATETTRDHAHVAVFKKNLREEAMRSFTSDRQTRRQSRRRVSQDTHTILFVSGARIANVTVSLLSFFASSDRRRARLFFFVPRPSRRSPTGPVRRISLRHVSTLSALGRKFMADCDFPRSRRVTVSVCSIPDGTLSLWVDSILAFGRIDS